MDCIKFGRRLAELRRRAGLTQQALGEKLGVTNKTVSRWETGAYLPDAEMLCLLSRALGVSTDLLLAPDTPLPEPQAADAPPVPSRQSAFTLQEQTLFWKRKWEREHRALLVLILALAAAALILPIALGRPWLACLAPLVWIVERCIWHNTKMAYVEGHLYDPPRS